MNKRKKIYTNIGDHLLKQLWSQLSIDVKIRMSIEDAGIFSGGFSHQLKRIIMDLK
jgi:hypothetical protein